MSQNLLEIGVSGLGFVLVAAWRALPLLLIVLLVDLVLRRRLASRYHAMLWTLVVIRLMLPLSLPSSWSWHGPIDRYITAAFNSSAGGANPPQAVVWSDPEHARIADAVPLPAPVAAVQAPSAGIAWETFLLAAATGLWALVAAGSILRTVFAHLRFAWRLRFCRELDDPKLVDVVLRECDALRVSRRPKLKEVPELSSPAVFGLLRYTICLPVAALESLSAQELRWVLRHELAHIRRRDTWLLSLASIMRSLHWFNPLAWLTVAKLRSHVEAAADELALDRPSKVDAVAYGRLLLKFAEQATTPSPSPAIGFLQFISGRDLRGRIEQLAHDRTPRRVWMRALIGIALLALAVIGLTDAAEREPEPPESFPSEWAMQSFSADLSVKVGDAETGPKTVRSYDVAEVLEEMRQFGWKEGPEDLLLNHIPGTLPRQSLRIEDSTLIADLTEGKHKELRELLDAWRLGGLRQISLEVRVLQASAAIAASLDWDPEKVDEVEQRGSQPVVATTASDAEMRRFMQALQADARSEILMAPKLTVFNGQTAAIEVLSQRPFVTGVRPLKDGAHQPVIQVLNDGLKIGLQPVVQEDEAIDVGIDLQASKIGDVALANLPFRDPDAPAGPVTVQVPEVSTTAVHVRTRLATGETLLIAAPQPFDQKSEAAPKSVVFYAITPRLLDVQE